MSEFWTSRRWSLANPLDGGATDLPHLLRRVATQIEEDGIDAMEILDLIISSEIVAEGPWWTATLYWSPDVTDEE